ncbi:hypothetical protein IPH19_00505 [Candidatus Uhrbacteria bacterium]|nr:MAG: hypothetical protein IPH19_00505 [Candidatus Uhrbacteria bacterium]
MFITTHAVLGALIAQQVPENAFAAFVLGMASHFISDIIPHGDTNLYKDYVSGRRVKSSIAYVTIDGILTTLFVLFIFNLGLGDAKLAITMGIIGGVLPDLLVGVYEVFRVPGFKWFHRLHFFFHNMVSEQHDMTFASGFAMQVLFLAGLLSLIV